MLLCLSFPVASWALFLIAESHAQAPTELTGCASHTPPFVLMKAGIGSTGYSVDYFKSVAKSMGRTGVIRELPWARCLRDVAAGSVDIAVDAYEDAERRTQFLFSKPYYTLTHPTGFLSPADCWQRFTSQICR
jgi:ABC-type amino acid transport substrate-binding protein